MIRRLGRDAPELGPGTFVHERAEVIGRVVLGARTSVWPMAVIRGDAERIAIGAETNLQDGVVVHADPGLPCVVGDRVTVGHGACLHGCSIADEVLIGIGSVVLNGARVGSGSIVGAGAVVPEGMQVPPGSLVLGVPARIVRETTPAQREGLIASARRYVALIDVHAT